ncbi:MAG: hypothetical protein CVU03_07220 [Bacteroidetes bacterium HGW-Bacteroidetes-2]|nr:MAG: hypothetical protein CVU03_07220 [Bacteroidetes bacterium HGW-Bacteroidetes-2]
MRLENICISVLNFRYGKGNIHLQLTVFRARRGSHKRTHLGTILNGDEKVLIGNKGNLEIGETSFNEFSNQINYEMLTQLPAAISKKIVD